MSCDKCGKQFITSRQCIIEYNQCKNVFRGQLVNLTEDNIQFILGKDEIW